MRQMGKRLIFSVGIGIVLALYLSFGISDMADLLAGPGWTEEVDRFIPFWMVNWIVLFLPAWFLGLWSCEDALNRGHMCVHRYRNVGRWWFRLWHWIVLNVAAAYLVMGVVLRLLAGSDWSRELTLCMLLITVHALFSVAFAVWIRILSGNMILAAICTLVPEGLAKVIVAKQMLRPLYSIFSWGMYNYSSLNYGTGGFGISTVVVIQLCITLSLLVCIFGKGKNILLRRINDGKIH